MKSSHYRNEKLQDRYSQRGVICPADLCDIFECPEFSEKTLKLQVYTDRTDGNYEGRPDYRDGSSNRKRAGEKSTIKPFRYEMMQHYDSQRRSTLLQKCHRTFLDCVDYQATNSIDSVMKSFDFFS